MSAPTPYECAGSDGGEFVICHKDKRGKRRTLAHVYDAETAAFIVRACNNHAALREVIEESLHPLAQAARLLQDTEAGDKALHAYNRARAVLIESQIPSQ